MINKYELIDQLIENVDELADARGARKCVLIISMIKSLDALKRGLMDDDQRARTTEAKEG